MLLPATRLWFVSSLSLSRLLAALLFSSLAFQNAPVVLVASLYLFAMSSDLVDGYLARRLKAGTYFGRVLDLVSDKSLTIVSLLYAAARGIDLAPLALIATRDLIMIGMRIIIVDRTQLLPTSRTLGGLMSLLLWGNTLLLVLKHSNTRLQVANSIYWACALVFCWNLVVRLYRSRERITRALAAE